MRTIAAKRGYLLTGLVRMPRLPGKNSGKDPLAMITKEHHAGGALFWCCAPVPCATQRLPPVTHKEGVPENKEKNHK